MRRCRNADEFLNRLRGITHDYEQRFRPRIEEVVAEYRLRPARLSDDKIDDCLEAHVRTYYINRLLAALNWQLDLEAEDGLPNLIPEVAIESVGEGTTRFLDYLGLESKNEPLLVVESKRPRSSLPRLRSDRRAIARDDELTKGAQGRAYADTIRRGLAGEPLREEWSSWLDTIRDYVRSVHAKAGRAPARVILTSGYWTVIFGDPANAFLGGSVVSAERISVFVDTDHLEASYDDVFRLLEHGNVVGKVAALVPGEVAFHMRADDVVRVMHGVIVQYIKIDGIYEESPAVRVAPVLLVRSRFGAWFRVEARPAEFAIPSEPERLGPHLGEVAGAAQSLLSEVRAQLGKEIVPTTLVEHYGDESAFEELPGISERRPDVFVVVTGDRTHYLLPEATVSGCPYHDWRMSKSEERAATSSPIESRSVEPRSFFRNLEEHHCTHRTVQAAKASRITAENLNRCGRRSGREGQAFCEIWRFEEYLCCRTCAFEEVCTKAEVFTLPCSR